MDQLLLYYRNDISHLTIHEYAHRYDPIHFLQTSLSCTNNHFQVALAPRSSSAPTGVCETQDFDFLLLLLLRGVRKNRYLHRKRRPNDIRHGGSTSDPTVFRPTSRSSIGPPTSLHRSLSSSREYQPPTNSSGAQTKRVITKSTYGIDV